MFLLVDGQLINAGTISTINFSKIEDLQLVIHRTNGQVHAVSGIQTIDILMALRPSAFEGKRMRWPRFAWAVHNLIGHPLMQLFAFIGKHELAMTIHDITVPRPQGRKIKKAA